MPRGIENLCLQAFVRVFPLNIQTHESVNEDRRIGQNGPSLFSGLCFFHGVRFLAQENRGAQKRNTWLGPAMLRNAGHLAVYVCEKCLASAVA